MIFPNIKNVKNRLSEAALSGDENVTVKTSDLAELMLYVSMPKSKQMKLADIVERAIFVVDSRDGDVDTMAGTFATVDTDEIIRLEEMIENFFELSTEELIQSYNAKDLIINTIELTQNEK